MNYRKTAVLLLLLALQSWARQSSPEVPSQTLIKVKQQAQALLTDVANYSCLETIERSRQQSRAEDSERDVFHVQVSVVNSKESFARPGSRQALPEDLATLGQRGLTATGVFSAFAHDVLASSNVSIYGAEQEHQILRYNFHVPPASSGWKLFGGGTSANVGERGLFSVDAHSLQLLSIEVTADEIPASLPFLFVHIIIDYSAGVASGMPSLVPASAEMWIRERSGELHHDSFFFSQCRKFSAESKVYFDTGKASGPIPEEAGQAVFVLPVGLTIPIELQANIDCVNAVPGTPVRAAVMRDVFWKGKLLIKNTTAIEGHIRAVLGTADPKRNSLIIEFDRLATEAGSVDFLAGLKKSAHSRSSANQAWTALPGETHREMSGHSTQADIPGVVTFVIDGGGCFLQARTKTEWTIQDLSQVRKSINSPDGPPSATDPRVLDPTSKWTPH